VDAQGGITLGPEEGELGGQISELLALIFIFLNFTTLAALLSASLRWRSFQIHSLDTVSGFRAGNLIV
jgi:hypothetical protein